MHYYLSHLNLAGGRRECTFTVDFDGLGIQVDINATFTYTNTYERNGLTLRSQDGYRYDFDLQQWILPSQLGEHFQPYLELWKFNQLWKPEYLIIALEAAELLTANFKSPTVDIANYLLSPNPLVRTLAEFVAKTLEYRS